MHAALSAVSPREPRPAHARQRPRRVRQRQGARARRARSIERRSAGRRAGARRGGRAHRSAARVGARTWSAPRSSGRARRDRRRRSTRELRRQVRLAGEEALRHGVTSFQDAGSSFATIDFLRRLEDEGALPVRLYVMVRPPVRGGPTRRHARRASTASRWTRRARPPAPATARSRGRRLSGGARASSGRSTARWARTAPGCSSPTPTCRAAPASCSSRWRRSAATPSSRSVTATSSPCTPSAIAPTASVLDIYEQAFARHGNPADLRWRIEHAQHLHPADVPRFARLGVIASMQGIHCTSDAPWVLKRLGPERAKSGAYLWRSLLDERRRRQQRHRRAGRVDRSARAASTPR